MKNGTVQDRIQFAKDGGLFKFIEGVRIAVNLFAPNLTRCRIHGTHRLPFEHAAIEYAAAF
jgi:hypothetical protein